MKKTNNKKIITTIIFIVLFGILLFVLLANPLPKKNKTKSYEESLETIKQIDIIVHSPYDNSNTFKANKTVIEKAEIDKIIDIIKDASITEEITNNLEQNDHFSYSLLLKNEDNYNNINIFVKDNVLSINGKNATLNLEKINELNNYIADNIKGFGMLNCVKENKNNTLVEKYYFKDNGIYHYSKSQTFIPEDLQRIESNIKKYNNYSGVTALGNLIDDNKYSYIIDIDLTLVSNDNYKEIVKKDKDELNDKTKDDLIAENKGMNCSFSFLV